MTRRQVIRDAFAILAAVFILFAITRPTADGKATGTASWYDDGPGLYGAVHSFSWGDPPYQVVVTAPNGKHVTVTVRDHCPCGNGLAIDLSPDAFAQLQPLSVGLIRHVTVTRVGGDLPPLPATDTE